MKASLRQLQAGAPGRQAAKGFGGRTASSLPSFPLVSLCVGGGNEGSGVGERFSKKIQEKKGLRHQVLGSQIASPEKSLFVLC